MRIVLIEDEPLIANALQKLVQRLVPNVSIEAVLSSVKAGVEWFQNNPLPDLIIADIQLEDGISLSIFNQIASDTPIIFTTAFDEYAIRAFKLNSIDYLLKPIDPEELKAAFDKYFALQTKYANAEYQAQLQKLFKEYPQHDKYKERFMVHSGKAMVLIPAHEVLSFEKVELILLHHLDGRKFITDYRSLDEVEALLNPAIFFRANRQTIIQRQFIKQWEVTDSSKLHVIMAGAPTIEIPISKEKAADFRKWISNE